MKVNCSKPASLRSGIIPAARALLRLGANENGSTFIIVLWIAFGLVSITLYFADSMRYESRAAETRVAGLEADHAIEGAARYVNYVLSLRQTNGFAPDPSTFSCEAVPVGEAHFWLIGRDTNSSPLGPGQIFFGLVDEASKMNLNSATSNMLVYLPRMNLDLVSAILDWRDTNGGSGASQTYYGLQQPPYVCKQAPFETVDELRLVMGADLDTLVGEDANRNGILDPNENDENHNSSLDPGVLEYLTVYSREPNTYSNGTPRVNIRTVTQGGPLDALLQGSLDAGRASAILDALFPPSPPNPRGGPARPPVILQFASPLAFYIRCHQPPASMTVDEFAQIANEITVTATTNSYIEGRINVNTASAAVLACLPGVSDNPDLAQTLINYRLSNPDKLTSIGWIVDALGQNNDTTLAALAAADCLTTQSYQFSADVAAVGAHGRGYRRVRFVFDTVDGTPKIVFRQDLTHLGWALGKGARESLLANNTR